MVIDEIELLEYRVGVGVNVLGCNYMYLNIFEKFGFFVVMKCLD